MLNKNNFLKFILLTGDVLSAYFALFLALSIRYCDTPYWWTSAQINNFLFHFSFIFLFWIVFLYVLDSYEMPPFRSIFDFIRNLIIFFFLAGVLGIIYFYLRPGVLIAPKTILFLDVLIFSILFCIWRYIFIRILKLDNFKEKIVIIGFRSGLEEIIDNQILSRTGYEISAFFAPEPLFLEQLAPFSNLAKYGVVSDINKLRNIIDIEKVGIVVFPRFLKDNQKIVQQIFSNLSLKINYASFASFYENTRKKVSLEVIDEIWFLENLARSEKRIEEIAKRGFDILFSFIGLLITIIIFPFIALAIKLDSRGSIFYSQKRIGRDGVTFTIYKFRTMFMGAEESGPQWAVANDPRITRVGKILRKIYFDEFPQFYNILKGDISFVGPRPERPEFVEKLKKEIPYYDVRHLLQPGFTGWAQINYHYSASVNEAKEKLQYDLYYVKNRNFFMDLGIILKTIRIIFR